MGYVQNFSRAACTAAVVCLFTIPVASRGGELALPSGPVLLTIDGLVTEQNKQGTTEFDMTMLKDLPAVSFETSTMWTEGVHTFTGVSLKTLLEHVGANGSVITATAINDYAIKIPFESLADAAPIIAYEIDGEIFPRRDKGPLWIVFPYDLDDRYRNETVFSQSIWQLVSLNVSN